MEGFTQIVNTLRGLVKRLYQGEQQSQHRNPEDEIISAWRGLDDLLLAWFGQQVGDARVKIEDQTFSTSMVAVQGPEVLAMLNAVLPKRLAT